MPTRMLVSPLSTAAENEQAHHRAAEDEEGRIDSGAEEKREYDHGDDHPDPAREGALGQADGSGGKEPDGDGSQPALYRASPAPPFEPERSEEHTSELQSRRDLVCRLLLEKKKKKTTRKNEKTNTYKTKKKK